MNNSTSTAPSGGMRNHYYVCRHHGNPIPWNPPQGDVDEMHTSYFGEVFTAMEETLEAEGLTFFLTFRLDELPRYGPDVVAVIMDDELGRYPAYANRVRAVFKTMGTDFPFEATPFQTPLDLTLITAVKYARTQMMRVPRLFKARRDQRQGAEWYGGASVPIYDVPVGYVNQEPLPLKPFAERDYDLFFSGSITNQRAPWYSPNRWLRTPKEIARSTMVQALRTVRDARPDLDILIDTWDSFVPHETNRAPAEESYSEMMMNTRICPVPRGTRLESARLYEAMRSGCVLLTEPLPDRWFLHGIPNVVVHDWAKLPSVVESLTSDPQRLEELHRASLQWWKERCSEAAVGRYVADQLNALSRRLNTSSTDTRPNHSSTLAESGTEVVGEEAVV